MQSYFSYAVSMPQANRRIRWQLHLHMKLRTQRGVALVVSLFLLLVLTMLAVTAVTTSSLGEKMAANLKDQRTAFQASESAMRAGEGWLQRNQFVRPKIPELATLPCTNGAAVCAPNFLGNLADPTIHPNSWWYTNGVAYGGTITQSAQDPRYVIESRDFVKDDACVGCAYADRGTAYYRVYGFGVGATENSTAIVADHYAFHVNE